MKGSRTVGSTVKNATACPCQRTSLAWHRSKPMDGFYGNGHGLKTVLQIKEMFDVFVTGKNRKE